MVDLITKYKRFRGLLSIVVLLVRFIFNIYLDSKVLEEIRRDGIDKKIMILMIVVIYNYISMIIHYRYDIRLIRIIDRMLGIGMIIVYRLGYIGGLYRLYIIYVMIKEIKKIIVDIVGYIVVLVIKLLINSGFFRVLLRHGITSGLLDEEMMMRIMLNVAIGSIKKNIIG